MQTSVTSHMNASRRSHFVIRKRLFGILLFTAILSSNPISNLIIVSGALALCNILCKSTSFSAARELKKSSSHAQAIIELHWEEKLRISFPAHSFITFNFAAQMHLIWSRSDVWFAWVNLISDVENKSITVNGVIAISWSISFHCCSLYRARYSAPSILSAVREVCSISNNEHVA